MRGLASLMVAGVLGAALLAGLGFRGSEARDDDGLRNAALHLPQRVPEPVAAVDTDATRRALLNARLKSMIEEGRGARLTDAARRSSVRAASGASSRSASTSTYRKPRLDLATPPRVPGSDLDCLTQAIYYEARSESEAGQTAVAEVVMNRVRHPAYPDRVCDVVYQRNSRTCQFTFTCDGSLDRGPVRQAAWSRAQRIAREVLDGRHKGQLPSASVNYHANYVRPSWGQRLNRVRQIGAHIFYGTPLDGTPTPGSTRTATRPTPAVEDSGLSAYERWLSGARDGAAS